MKQITKGYYGLIVSGVLSLAIIAGCGKESTTADDTTAPANTTVSNFISSGAASTSSTTATLAISATDSVGVTGYYASEASTEPSASATGWTSVTSTTSYSASVSFTFSNEDGTKTIYVWFKDAAGNVSAATNDTISLAQATNPLVGSWFGDNVAGAAILTFLSDGTYMLAEDIESDPCAVDGMEKGTYTSTANTITIADPLSVDTNGCGGLSDVLGIPVQYSISGNQMTLFPSTIITKVVAEENNPLVGSWSAGNTLIIFLSDGSYFHVEAGSSTSTGWSGMERGAYTSTATTFTPTVLADTNGDWGLSDGSGTQISYTISGNQLTLSGGYTFTRVQ